jgi:hypothetical protein
MFDDLLHTTGNNSGGGIMDRMVSQLLTEIDQVVSSNASAAAATATANSESPGQEIGKSEFEGQLRKVDTE